MINSVPCSVSACAAQMPAFKSVNSDMEGSIKMAKIDPDTIRTKGGEIADNADAIADTIDRTTNSVTNAVTKTTGACALIMGAFNKLIPASVKDFFATPQFKLNEAGEKVLEKIKGSDGVERVVRKFNAKNTAIAAGVAFVLIGGYSLVIYLKNRPKPTKDIAA